MTTRERSAAASTPEALARAVAALTPSCSRSLWRAWAEEGWPEGLLRRFAIGIDPGVSTGWGVYDSVAAELVVVKGTTFWGAADALEAAATLQALVVIEDPAANPPTFRHFNVSAAEREKISRNIGANAAHGKLLQEQAERLGLHVLLRRPTAKSGTKLDAERFRAYTGWPGNSNEHSRDAAMHCFGVNVARHYSLPPPPTGPPVRSPHRNAPKPRRPR